MSRPVAIIGAACRFPDKAVDLDGYWRLLDERGDAVREVPHERWDPAKWLDPNVEAVGKTYSARGTFVSDIDRFDAWFFQISPREAKSVSPEQRLLLEVTWEAIENARLLPERVRDSGAGVFVGVAPTVYGDAFEGVIPPRSDVYAVTGRLTSFDAGRLSYVLGFRGPSIAVDTACSSSLVAIHLACRSLQAGECSVAVAAAVNVLLNPISYVDMSRMRALSRSGACRSFDAGADGYVRGEGCGAVVLKLLDDALRDGDEVLAVIRGSAVNHDGASSGLTVPSRHAQEELLRAALRDAGVRPADVDYVEAHGTGTPLGDPIEALALGAVFGESRPADRPLSFGSVKTNIGHLESAAGMASVLKLVLALRHERLPAQLHLREPNPAIPWAELPLRIAGEPQEWRRRQERPRIAGVSAFGISGTNAHLVIEEPPLLARRGAASTSLVDTSLVDTTVPASPLPLPFLVSAKSKAALQAQADRIRAFALARQDVELVDIAGSLAMTRSHFEERAVVVAGDRPALLDALTSLGQGTPSASVVVRRTQLPGKLVFVFAGHGSQWAEMALGLLDSSPVFRESIERCEQAFASHVDWSLVDVLRGSPGAPAVERIDVVQPVLFAMSVSLAAVWRSLGIEPDAVVGHSLGEIAAAYVAGALSLEDAARVVALRGLVLARLEGKGAVASVDLPVSEIRGRLGRFDGRLVVGAVNSPTSTLVSGDPSALDELLTELEAAEIFARKVRIDYASHGPQIDAVRDELLARVGSVVASRSDVAICSTVTGDLIDGTELDLAYWYRNCRQEVRFADAVQKLLASGHRYFIEVSAHPVLTSAIASNIETSGKEAAVVGSLRRNHGDWSRLVASLGELHTVGYPVDWRAFFSRLGARNVTLPTYPFQRKRFWLEAPKASEVVRAARAASDEHPFFDTVIPMAESDAFLFTGRFSLSEQRWLRDHVVEGQAMFPATGFLELAFAAADRAGLDEVEELTLEVPLVLPQSGGVRFQLWLGAKDEAGRRSLSLHGRRDDAGEDAPWTRHAMGTLGPTQSSVSVDLRAWPPVGAAPLPVEGLYERLAAAGLRYGETFRGVASAWKTPDALYAEVRLPEEMIREAATFALHPALLDAALHPLALLDEGASGIALPFSWGGVRLLGSGASTLRVCLSEGAERGSFSLLLANGSGEPVGSVAHLVTRATSASSVRHASTTSLESLHRIDWIPVELPSVARASDAPWALWGADELAIGRRLAKANVALESHEDAPSVHRSSVSTVLVSCASSRTGSVGEDARAAAHRALALVQTWLADSESYSKQLVIVTRGAVATTAEDAIVELPNAVVWGLVRSVQSESPDRSIVLVDIDEDGDLTHLRAALASAEPQVAIRGGRVLAPRLSRARATAASAASPLMGGGTVLITGGTGALGAVLARHLVAKHGIRSLLLTSRQGMASPGAEPLQRELEAAGAAVVIASCDVANRDAVARLLEAIPAAHPLTAVIHAAGVVDDGVVEALTPARIDRVFAPKVDAAVHLDELTRALPLTAFVLFSSVAGIAGAPGQGNYAAANAFLDALAQERRQRGLVASSLAWGYWAERSKLTEHLKQADLTRFARLGLERLSIEEGLSLFDAALVMPDAVLVPVRLNRAVLAGANVVPPLLRALVRPSRRAIAAGAAHAALSSLAARLATLPEGERVRTVLELVRGEIAIVLGARPESIDGKAVLTDVGLDSLMAVELRNRLVAVTGLRLPATLLFDQPTPASVARYIAEKLAPSLTAGVAPPKPFVVTAPQTDDPIVVVAMSCRYPGAVRSPEELWQFVVDGKDAISDFPKNRGWPSLADLFDPDPTAKGKCYVRQGGFLHDADQFDPAVFGVSQREAPAIDPQQRLLLETSWEAFERAGIAPPTLNGSRTGVFVGVMYSDYGGRFTKGAGEYEGYVGIGSAPSVASGRIAYTFGLQGPAVTLDTACSSSLVALHLACQSLRSGECSMALAGGVTVMATPGAFVEFSRQRALAPDGRCKAFGADADGTVWSEGVGMLLLERLSDARRNGHPVLAVIRSSAVNQDGKSQGLTAPNGPAQQRVIEQALASAGLSPIDIDVVEAHGTGTALGDPIEAEALFATYGAARSAEGPLWLGSLKSNFGHTQAAAGVAGIIKMVFALERGMLPKTLFAETPSPHVDWSSGAVRLLTEPVAWQRRDTPRRAGVSSFGISGTNAHVIIEGPPSEPSRAEAVEQVEPPTLAFVVSAKTTTALTAQATQLLTHLDAHPELRLVDVAHSLATTRTHFEARAVVVARDRHALVDGLGCLAESRSSGAVLLGDARLGGKLAVLFTGQGSQYAQMGHGLHSDLPVFRQALDAVCAELDPHLPRPLRDVLFASPASLDASLLNETAFTQPALFALEVALYRVVESWGVVPSLLLGHSVGEISAAHVSGVLDLANACKLIAARGRLMQALPAGGAMVAIRASEAEVAAVLAGRTSRVSIASINGPQSIVIAGDEVATLDIARHFESLGRKASKLVVSHAFHSPRMDAMLAELGEVVRGLRFEAPRIPIVSNVTGRRATEEELRSPAYWVRHVRDAVRFFDGMRSLEHEGVSTFLELGPRGVLSSMGQDCLESPERATFLPVLRNERSESETLLAAIGGAHARGQAVDWKAVFDPFAPRHTALPTYAFDHRRFWLDVPKADGNVEAVGISSAQHPLLGATVTMAETDALLFTGRLSVADQPWLGDHVVFGTVVVPGTAFVELGLVAAERLGLDGIDELTIEAPLAIPSDEAVDVQLWVGGNEQSGRRSWTLHSRLANANKDALWTRHIAGTLGSPKPAIFDMGVWPPTGAIPASVEQLYERTTGAGLSYGEAFLGVTAVWTLGSDFYAEVSLPDGAGGLEQASRFGLHPALLDAALQPVGLTEVASLEAYVPFAWGGIRLYASGASSLRVHIAAQDERNCFSVRLSDTTGAPVATIESIRLRAVSRDQVQVGAATAKLDSLYRVDWLATSVTVDSRARRWAILGDDALGLAARLEKRGVVTSSCRDLLALRSDSADVVLLCREQPTSASLHERARAATHETLALLQAWLADGELASKQLVILTRRAVAARTGEPVDDVGLAAVWGLVRSAQSENPDRSIVLVDIDEDGDLGLLAGALASGEPQLAIRRDEVFVPRLKRVAAGGPTVTHALDPEGTVLVTGGLGVLGALFARHLVAKHGIRHLLLTSRQGPASPGADSLQHELESAGARVTIAACDVSNRDEVANLLGTISPEHPLRAIVHAAGVLDDGVIGTLTPERIDRVFAPKVDAAVHLHELTMQRELHAFVLFSSASGVAGAPGQGNYAAANAFLDALAEHRHARGLPASSLAWGYWEDRGSLTAHLTSADLSRLARMGIERLSAEEGLALFDSALVRPEPTLVPMRLDNKMLKAAAVLPPLLRELVRRPRRAAAAQAPAGRAVFAERFATLPEGERLRSVLDLVRGETAVVLGARPETIDAGSALKDFGLDSLMAVELRNRLATATGLRLPATLLFDRPTPEALARHLEEKLRGHQVVAAVGPKSGPAPASEDDPIVVVAMSCRYPGGVHSSEELWQLVLDGRDAVGGFPTNRGWPSTSELFDPDPDAKGKTYVREGGFLHDADKFDPAFFGISQREATTIDPQHRLLLETAWETFERAGILPASLLGSKTGVFVGASYGGYGGSLLLRSEEFEGLLGIGSAPSIASGRIAYTFGLQGPALTLDTACSSSLVALHLACQAVRNGECSIALAGGVMIMASPASFVEFSRQRALAPDGRCKAFSARADGTSWAEGVGLLLVERLSDARRNGHPILAVVRGSAVNQDGKSQGLTAPNGLAQQQVILQALASAGLSTSDVDVVEAHGTGTTLGDPIEAEALLATYGGGHTAERPLWLGSVKSNIGHTQAAAGVAGIMKMVHALEHDVLPRSLFADSLSPHVDWSTGTVRLLDGPVAWRATDRPRRAAISAFGISGTNAHVIIEEPPVVAQITSEDGAPTMLPFILSAKTDAALRLQAIRLRAHLEARPDLRPVDVAYSLATTRSRFERCTVVVASDRGTLLEGLASFGSGAPSANLTVGFAKTRGKLAILFTGQGSQYAGMGRALYDAVPEFRDALDAVCAELERQSEPVRLRDVLFALPESREASLLDETELTQPALFAIEVALYRVLEAWGVAPDLLLGHSIGEVSAAHVAGVLSLVDACKLVVARGRLMQVLPRGGAMVAVQDSEHAVAKALVGLKNRIDIASINGPMSTVISGDEELVLEVARHFESSGRKTSRLKVSHAFHSARIDGMLEPFAEVLRTLRFDQPRISIVSTLTGRRARAEDLTSVEYWVRQVRETVRFAEGIRSLQSEGAATFVEVGPQGVLSAMAHDCFDGADNADAAFIPVLRRDRSEMHALVAAMSAIHTRGLASDWTAFFASKSPRRVPLPTYAFDRGRFWLDPLAAKAMDVTAAGLAAVDHPLVGASVQLGDSGSFVFTGRLSLAEHPWLGEMTLLDSAVFPAGGFVELALAAADRVGMDMLEELSIDVPLVMPPKGGVQYQLVVEPRQDDGRRKWTLDARASGASERPWTRHARGEIGTTRGELPTASSTWPPDGAAPVSIAGLYERLAGLGRHYGSVFRGLEGVWRKGRELFAEVRLPDEAARGASKLILHPALLETALHPLVALAEQGASVGFPFTWTGVRVLAAGERMVRVHLSPGEADDSFSVVLTDAEGRVVAAARAVRVAPLTHEDLRAASSSQLDALYRVDWRPIQRAAAEKRPARWALWGDDALGLGARLESAGIPLETIAADASLRDSAADVIVVCRAHRTEGSVAEAAHHANHDVLATLRTWLAAPDAISRQLVIVTRNAVSTRVDEAIVDLAGASAWGLVRSAQSENSDISIVLVDVSEDADLSQLPSALASGETQLAIRRSGVLVPRLVRVSHVDAPLPLGRPLDTQGTVLITGGIGALGALFARHLATKHGVRHLLLVSRQGPSASGADSLRNELEGLGAHVTIASCDVGDAASLAELLASIPSEHPLTAVIHTAGLIDDGVIDSLTPDRIDRVFRPKVDAAFHLHRLTEHMGLSAFVLFSSVAGIAGAPGQGNYAAANAFLDALAQHRHARGLAASSLAWGYWAARGALTEHLTDTHVSRLARLGVDRLSSELGLSLFDASLVRSEPVLVPVQLDLSVIQRMDVVPPILSALVRTPLRRVARRSGTPTLLAKRLAGLAEADRARVLHELVRAEAAAVLGTKPESIDVATPLKSHGLDSLMAVELRNRLAAGTGLRLPVTVLFDYPTPSALAGLLGEQLGGRLRRVVAPAVPRVIADDDPIVIVSMGCRFPGGVRSPEELWNLVADGKNAISDFPSNRGWKLTEVYDPDPEASGKSYTRRGGFLHDADMFDPGFFGISSHEARGIDPQQRLLLETSWEAIERAGIDPDTLQGSRTGVFVGVSHTDYALLQDLDDLDGSAGLGSLPSVASGRIAYTLGLHGPALTVDTACSSSLVTIHLAVQALRNGECSLALAGGVNVMATPTPFIIFSRQRALAPDGQCKSFSANADGTSWAEGAGMLLLERLSDARRNGHPVLAVLRGSAVNQDGRSQGLTAPNGPAQESVIEQALLSASLSAADIDVVEAHGTGTSLGDPIEAQALFSTYGRAHSSDAPLWLGSVKSNIGHTQAAAGVASVIKTVLAMKHGVLPRTLHAESRSPHIDWSSGTIQLLGESVPWKRNGRARRAGVSSFGISGTNAHLVLEEPPVVEQHEGVVGAAMPLPVILSAKSENALRAQARSLREHLLRDEDVGIHDLAFSLATTRSRFAHRIAFVASDTTELGAALAAYASDGAAPSAFAHHAASDAKLAVLFTGQGSQRPGMGRRLYESFPIFREAIDACAAHFDAGLERPLREVLFAENGSASAEALDQTLYAQPALFSLEVALFRLLESWSVRPDFLVGHSLGEIVAAHVSDVLSLEHACTLVLARAQLMQSLPVGGGMLAIDAGLDELAPLLEDYRRQIDVAAVNTPASVVVSGDVESLVALQKRLETSGRTASRLRVSHAFHSHLMEPMLDGLRRVANALSFGSPRIPIVSNLSGAVARESELQDPEYWVRHVRHAVRFGDCIGTLSALGARTFLEVGPHATLGPLAEDVLLHGDAAVTVLPTLRRDGADLENVAIAVGALHSCGHEVDWARFFDASKARRVDLPTYAFQRQRFWLDGPKRHSLDVMLGAPWDQGPVVVAAPEPTDPTSRPSRRLRDAFQFDPFAHPPQTTLAQAGIDSLGLANIKSILAALPGGKVLARRLTPLTPLAELLPFVDASAPAEATATMTLTGDLEWQDVTPQSVNKQRADNVLLSRAAIRNIGESTQVIAELRSNREHPFFYEHPLDHVPGLYLIEAVRQLGNWILFASKGQLERGGTLDHVEADFFEFVEHDQPVHLATLPSDAAVSATTTTYSVQLFQGGRMKAVFTLSGRRIALSTYTDIRNSQRERTS